MRWAVLLLAGCSDYGINGKERDVSGGPADADTATIATDTAATGGRGTGTETDTPCDGGAVQPAWTVGAVEPDPTAGDPVCTDVGAVDWDVVEKWSTSLGGLFVMNPIVAPNAGRPGASVFLDLSSRVLVELDGRDGSVVQAVAYGTWSDDGSTAFVGDSDGDGFVEVALPTWSEIHLVDMGTGAVTTGASRAGDDEVITRADVDLDGRFEVLLPDTVFGDDLATLRSLGDATQSTGTFLSDLDGDGRPELVNGAGVWDPADGSGVPWDARIEGGYSFMGAPVEVGSGAGVIFGTGGRDTYLAHADGSLAWRSAYGGAARLASLADATGDGVPDLCVTDDDAQTLRLVDVDGNPGPAWTFGPMTMVAGGCSMADLDADGVYEVLLLGYDGFWILDGRTGGVLLDDPAHHTSPRDCAPVVADVDGDGSAEIVLVTDDGVVALGPATGRWARTRRVWNQLAYDVTSIRDDGTLVAAPAPVWSTYGVFRAQPSHDGAHPDLAISAAAGADECGRATLAIDVRNQGSVAAAAGAAVRVLGDAGGALAEVARTTLPDAISPGEHVAATLVVDPASLGTWWVAEVLPAHDDECDFTNDRAEGAP